VSLAHIAYHFFQSVILILAQDPLCFGKGVCTFSSRLQAYHAVDERDCLRRCKVTLGCHYFNYSPLNFRTCELLSNCAEVSEDCDSCRIGKKGCQCKW